MTEKEFLEYLFSPETLTRTVPRMETVFKNIQHDKKLLSDTSYRGKYTEARGFDEGRLFQHVAHLTPAALAAIYEYEKIIGKSIMNDRKEFYKWLNGPGWAFDERDRKGIK